MSADRGDRDVDELREFMAAHGLLPPVPSDHDEREQAAGLLHRVLAQNGPPRRRSPVGLAAVLVLLLVLGAGYALMRTAPPAAAGAPRALRYSVASPVELAAAPSATISLLAMARAADTAPAASHTGTGTVQYVADYGWLLAVDVTATATTTTIYPTMTQRWTSPDGSVRVDQRRTGALKLDGTVSDDASISVENQSSDAVGAGTVDAALAGQLPLETDALRTDLLDRYESLPCEESDAWTTQCLLTAIQEIYSQYVVPPALSASLWRVLAYEPGVKDLGTTDDRLGRRAHAIAVQAPDDPLVTVVTVLLIDPGTGALLGSETVTVHDGRSGAAKATVTAFTSLTTSAWVDAVGDQREDDDDD
ncbi:CU044_5270 family protein [Pengzhenrongella phosphoraccumulans]|uniref:CU044_5270 family protein n=1 Tax=Pengzhenrongella phosphoraccumulans TaxID=3114394 RepID=UPI00388DAC2D